MRERLLKLSDGQLRLLVFLVALVPRLLLAWVTFGSTDMNINFHNSTEMLAGDPRALPYFRGVELWIWLSTVLDFHTALPAAFPYKLLPVVCDALIAMLLFDAARERAAGIRDGLLYAIAPVPFIVSAIAFQWDSVWMYFLLLALVLLRGERESLVGVAGAAFVLSVVVKPIAAPLALLLLPLEWRRARGFILGALACVVVYCGVIAAAGYPLSQHEFIRMFRYAHRNESVVFGLPFTPFSRLWGSVAIALIVAVLHRIGRMTQAEGTLVFMAFAIGFSGLAPQYLAWVVPFALLAAHRRFLAIQTAAAGTFLAFFFQVPRVNIPNWGNLGTFAMLRPLGRFSPPLPSPTLRVPIEMLGNYVIPLICIAFVAFRLVESMRRPTVEVTVPMNARKTIVPAAMLLIALAIGSAIAGPFAKINPRAFAARLHAKIDRYDAIQIIARRPDGMPSRNWMARSLYDPSVGNTLLNIGNALLLLTLVAASATALWDSRDFEAPVAREP